MALSKSTLKVGIITELTKQGFLPNDANCMLIQFAEALANAIIDEITTNALCSGVDSNGDSHSAVKIV